MPQRCLVGDVLTQEVTARNVRDAEPRSEQLGLRALPGAGRTDQQKSHLMTVPLVALCLSVPWITVLARASGLLA
jgi:hypothetical protein